MKDFGSLGHLFACAFLFNFSTFMVVPAITDVMMEALCPGQDQCSLAIYLSGLQLGITGLGTLIITPFVGNLSDKYGRKALLMLPMTVTIVPLGILAYDQSKTYFCAYYVIKMLTGMFSDGSMRCLTLAYVADEISAKQRVSAFSVLSGISTAGFLCGTLTARFLPTAYIFQTSAAVAVIAATYMRVFVKETDGGASLMDEESTQPLCSATSDGESYPTLPALKKMPSLNDMISLLSSSTTLTRAAIVAFFYSLAENGLTAALLYYLKAQFKFSKDQFADLLLIGGVVGVFSQLVLMPLLAPAIGEERLLIVGLLASCAHSFLYSIAWSYWVPYLAASFVILIVFIHPCIRSIVSKKVGPSEQGMAQGCIAGISSFGDVIAPLIFTPLTACFLSENAPFNFKGFSIMCSGFATLIAIVLCIRTMTAPFLSLQKV